MELTTGLCMHTHMHALAHVLACTHANTVTREAEGRLRSMRDKAAEGLVISKW